MWGGGHDRGRGYAHDLDCVGAYYCGIDVPRRGQTSGSDGEGTKIGDIGVHYISNNGESNDGSNKNIGGRKCMTSIASCGDITGRKVSRRNNNIITDNGSGNIIGVNRNSNSDVINGANNQNGNNTVNGPASVNAINSVIGDSSGNVNNAVNVKGKVPPHA
ncbi:hypothetical protein LXL04_037404 [Taraxacum kok-saghyz]